VTNIAGSLDGSQPILAGAAVEGPNGFAATGSLTGMRAPAQRHRHVRAVQRQDGSVRRRCPVLLDGRARDRPDGIVSAGVAWQVRGTPPPAPGGGGPVTVVTVRFDDGNTDQLKALNLLSPRNMAATFYINSGFIGDSIHLSVADLQTLYAAGNEIGGPTIDHAKIKKLKTAAARYEVCTDRNTLLGCGFPVTSFAYPYGSYDAGSELVVHD